MQLQDNITNLQAAADNETGNTDVITFEDVCLNPLSDEMDPSAGGCTIFSGGFLYFHSCYWWQQQDWFHWNSTSFRILAKWSRKNRSKSYLLPWQNKQNWLDNYQLPRWAKGYIDVGEGFCRRNMVVKVLRCWLPIHCIEEVTKIMILSPISKNCHHA